MQLKRKLEKLTWENGKEPNFGPQIGPKFGPIHGFP